MDCVALSWKGRGGGGAIHQQPLGVVALLLSLSALTCPLLMTSSHSEGQIGASVKAAAAKVDPSIIVTICGSFRRGKASSGDIDIHITRPNFKLPQEPRSANNPLKAVVAALKATGLITDTLSHGGQKYQGVCKLDPSAGHHRRIDIMSTVMDQYYTGICYFTGVRKPPLATKNLLEDTDGLRRPPSKGGRRNLSVSSSRFLVAGL